MNLGIKISLSQTSLYFAWIFFGRDSPHSHFNILVWTKNTPLLFLGIFSATCELFFNIPWQGPIQRAAKTPARCRTTKAGIFRDEREMQILLTLHSERRRLVCGFGVNKPLLVAQWPERRSAAGWRTRQGRRFLTDGPRCKASHSPYMVRRP